VHIIINGEVRDTTPGVTLLGLIESLGLDVRRIAVAVNGAVVQRGDLAVTVPADGDRIEIIEAVGGG